MNRFFKIILLVVLLIVTMVGIYVLTGKEHKNVTRQPEITDLTEKNFQDITVFLKEQAKENGAVYAFEVLKVAKLPPNTDLHLLGHVVGDELFKQQGIEGITHCTQDFRNACSHSIVVGLYLREHEAAFPQIARTCSQAPGGSGAYIMCYHGLGHGILAALDYDLSRAVDVCQQTGTPQHNFLESGECAGGAVMEIISGGDHNRSMWEEQSPKYFRNDDPLYPCTADFMPESAKPLCYLYLTPHLLTYVGADLASPGPDDFRKAMPLCDRIPQGDGISRESCFGGFGKEFIVLVKARDIRTLVSLADDEIRTVIEWCRFAGKEEGVRACTRTAVNSLYWGGENDPAIAVRFCGVLSESEQPACFDNLIGAAYFYNAEDRKALEGFCTLLPQSYQQSCRTKGIGA